MLTVRPYTPQDEAAVYEICRRTCDDGMDGTEIFPNHPELIGDKLVRTFISLSPQYCFVVEDDQGICGYVLGALDSKEFKKAAEMNLFPVLREKYPKSEKTEGLTPAEEIICSFHNDTPSHPESLTTRHPSIIRMDMLTERVSVDDSAVRRSLASAVSALKVNGSHGMFTEINIGDHNTIEMYTKHAFYEVLSECPMDDIHVFGRVF